MSASSFSPGSTIGILGGGQLARMLCMEAKRMGYKTLVWTGGLEAPASALCDQVIELPFDDLNALQQFNELADVATAEFENIPRATLDAVEAAVALRPSAHAIATCANRELEKNFLRSQGVPCAPFWIISNAEELAAAMAELAGPGVLKTSAFGYDGKGQRKLQGDENPQEVWQAFQAPRAILEGFITFQAELSVMIARNANGEVRCFDVVENHHRRIVDERTRDRRFLLHARGKLVAPPVEEFVHVELIGDPLGAPANLRVGQPVEFPEIRDHLPRRQPSIERGAGSEKADLSPDLLRFARDVAAGHRRTPTRRFE